MLYNHPHPMTELAQLDCLDCGHSLAEHGGCDNVRDCVPRHADPIGWCTHRDCRCRRWPAEKRKIVTPPWPESGDALEPRR